MPDLLLDSLSDAVAAWSVFMTRAVGDDTVT
jgi:hypothetical protein